jgi:hypothetical protein
MQILRNPAPSDGKLYINVYRNISGELIYSDSEFSIGQDRLTYDQAYEEAKHYDGHAKHRWEYVGTLVSGAVDFRHAIDADRAAEAGWVARGCPVSPDTGEPIIQNS